MKVWIVVLRVFGYLWAMVGTLLILVGIAGTWTEGGFYAVKELMSPFNVINWIAMAITLAPGLGALIWAKNLSEKQVRPCNQPSNL